MTGRARFTTLKSRIGRKAPARRIGRANQRRGSATLASTLRMSVPALIVGLIGDTDIDGFRQVVKHGRNGASGGRT